MEARLGDRLRELSPVVVALSGGVDSCYLLAAAADALGANAHAAIGVSPSLGASELSDARRFAHSIGVTLLEVPTYEMSNAAYVANTGDRCFHCKTELYERLLEGTRGIAGRVIADGTNASDVSDDRPGMRAARELGVVSPLKDVGLTKADIRSLAKRRGLAVWDKPEAACLASRVPVGTAVTTGRLVQIERAEAALKGLGFRHVRVRHHDRLARIEVDASDMSRLAAAHAEAVAALEALGYDYVTLDLGGYKRGGRVSGHGQDDEQGV